MTKEQFTIFKKKTLTSDIGPAGGDVEATDSPVAFAPPADAPPADAPPVAAPPAAAALAATSAATNRLSIIIL